MAAYFNEPDISAHKNAGGPNSEAVSDRVPILSKKLVNLVNIMM